MQDLIPNLVDRLYLLLDEIGAPSQIYWGFELERAPDPERLLEAVQATLTDAPRLRSRVKRSSLGYTRALLPLNRELLEQVVTFLKTPQEVERFEQARPVLGQEPPFRLGLLRRDDGSARLLIAMHHSACDANGALIVIRRLAEHYGRAGGAGPTVKISGRATSFRGYVQEMDWRDRAVTALRTAHIFRMFAGLFSAKAEPVTYANFIDRALPSSGKLRYKTLSISFDRISQAMRWAVKRGGTPLDVLITAAVRAGAQTWPPEDEHPIMVDIPVNLRAKAEQDVANRVGVIDFLVPAKDALNFEQTFPLVQAATTEARAKTPAVHHVFRRALISYLPPDVFRRLAGRYFDKPVNTRETIVVSALDLFENPLANFGSITVKDNQLYGSLLAPPGIRLGITNAGGRINITAGFLDPTTRESSIDRFFERFEEALGLTASTQGKAS